jgi:hypothetical protein
MDSVHIKGRISRELGIIYVFFCSKKEILFHKIKGQITMNYFGGSGMLNVLRGENKSF